MPKKPKSKRARPKATAGLTAKRKPRRKRGRPRSAASPRPRSAAAAGGPDILTWEDDPRSGAPPVRRQAPDIAATSLPLAIQGAAPAVNIYSAGSPEFRYWNAAGALRRGADFWAGILPPGTMWQRGGPLAVFLDEGVDLDAYYDRRSLSFFHDQVGTETIYSGESPDIICHELGHAVLDAIRPQLWDAASDEAAAFHESFGDITAILSGLQVPTFRAAVLTETGGHLYRNSRLSRIGEQLGRALNQRRPDKASPDALRNASNSFFYSDPIMLPPTGPDSQLTSQPHSFSRVFTGGFFDMLSGILAVLSSVPTEDDLLQASQDAGRLIVDAVGLAPVVPDYFSQVAAHVIKADAARFSDKYGEVIKSAFVRRGILSLQSAAQPPPSAEPGFRAAAASSRRGTGARSGSKPAAAVSKMTLPGDAFGLGGKTLVVQAPVETRRLRVSAAAVDMGSAPRPTVDRATRAFLEVLFRRGRVDFSKTKASVSRTLHPGIRKKTHELVERRDGLHLERRIFDCGFDCGCPWP